jgi:predicted CopG family antitoxin
MTRQSLKQEERKQMRHIAVDDENYFWLKALGQTGDSFNHVLTGIRKGEIEI